MFSSPPTRSDVLAAVDIGTNNCRLLIARCTETPPLEGGPPILRPEIVDAFSRLVRLGEGLSKSAYLQEDAIARTLEALSVCYAKMQRRGVTRYRIVATESCRRSTNAQDFISRAKATTGLIVDVISAEEEARLAVQGCLPLFEPEYDCVIHFDIGGGSTELALAKTGGDTVSIMQQISLPCGVTTMTEIYGSDYIDEFTYQKMVAEVKSHIAPFATAVAPALAGKDGKIQFVGCAGTVSTIAALVQDLPIYRREAVDGYHLDAGAALDMFKKLRVLNFLQRAEIPTLGHERADLIIAGCAIVEAIITTWDTQLLRVADRGVREGILLDLLGHKKIG